MPQTDDKKARAEQSLLSTLKIPRKSQSISTFGKGKTTSGVPSSQSSSSKSSSSLFSSSLNLNLNPNLNPNLMLNSLVNDLNIEKPRTFLNNNQDESDENGEDEDMPFTPTKPPPHHTQSQKEESRLLREAAIEIASVSTLQSNPLQSAPKHEFKRLAAKHEIKRERHTQTYKLYKTNLTILSDEIEIMYVNEADLIKSALNDVDDKIVKMFNELDINADLERQQYTYVTQMWSNISTLLSKRTTSLQNFAINLDDFEFHRSTILSKHLLSMVDTMITIGLKLPQEIERITEIESYDINTVIIGNRRAHSALIARMEIGDGRERVTCREKWEKRLKVWRGLRHERGVREFISDINDDYYMNPDDRKHLFEEFKINQSDKHTVRCEILSRLGSLNNTTLSETSVNEINAEFNTINTLETNSISDLYTTLQTLKDNKHNEAENRRELLRAELHNYGALHLAPDLERLARSFEGETSSVVQEDFYRKSGDLKAELVKLTMQLRDPALIYQKYLQNVKKDLLLVQCGLQLNEILELQGKSSLRKSCQDSLERLRKATKSEVLPILPSLKLQCINLAGVPGIDELLQQSLTFAAEGIQALITQSNYMASTRASQNSDFDRNDEHKPPTDSAPPSASALSASASVRSSNRSGGRRSASAASKGWDDNIDLDMLQVRTIQKQVGMLLAVSDLSNEFKETLRETLVGLEEKEVCNKAIDEAIFVVTTKPIKDRDLEQEALIDWVEQSLSNQSAALTSGAEKMCSFYLGVAKILETHRVKEIEIDDHADEGLFRLKDDFRLDDDTREKNEENALDRLRHAADEKELDKSFTKAISLLNVIESEYRVYHTKGTRMAGKHPVVVDEEHRHYCFSLCDRFGLIPPKPMQIPKEPVELRESKKPKPETSVSLTLGASVIESGDVMMEDKVKAEGQIKSDEGDVVSPRDGDEEGKGGVQESDEDAALRLQFRAAEEAAKNAKRDEEETAAAEEAKKHIAEALWTPDITSSFSTSISLYEYGIKVDVNDMVKEILAPSATDADEDVLPLPYPVPMNRTVKTQEELEQIEIEKEKAASAAAEAAAAPGKKGKKASPKPTKAKKGAAVVLVEEVIDVIEPIFFEEDFELKSDDVRTELSDSERDVYNRELDRSFLSLSEEQVLLVPEPNFKVYMKILSEVNIRRADKSALMTTAIEKRDATPVDKDGVFCIHVTLLPSTATCSYLTSLRSSLLSTMENDSTERKVKIELLCDERQEDLTEELEERLRLHWPRKGRTEVKYRQPREGELIAHQQKNERFLRQFYARLDEQEAAFFKIRDQVNEGAGKFVSDVEILKVTLQEQISLAALQGVEMKVKKLLHKFKPACEEYHERLDTFTNVEPERLIHTCDELIRLTQTFKFGGDYDKKEIDDLKLLLIAPREKVGVNVANRIEVLSELLKIESDSVDVIKTFKVEYERCLQELSLREGLGKKYGAPRRNAQERLRTEVTRCEFSADRVDELLNQLEGLCVSAKRRMFDVKSYSDEKNNDANNDDGDEDGIPYAVRIRRTMLSIRSSIYIRAQYLEFIVPNTSSLIDAASEIPHDLESQAFEATSAHRTEDPIVAGTFTSAIISLQDRCRAETKEMYVNEGKTDLLDPSGVPDALAKWLDVNLIKVLGPSKSEILNTAVIISSSSSSSLMGEENSYTVKYLDGLEETNIPAVLIRAFNTTPVRAPSPPVHPIGAKVQVHFQSHLEKSRRKLRRQVDRFEFIISKVPPVPVSASTGSGGLGAPGVCVRDVMIRSTLQSSNLLTTAEAGFTVLMTTWNNARKKHVNSLRPQLGSPDAKDELNRLKTRELQRANEVQTAVLKFKNKLIEMEKGNAKSTIERLVSCLKCNLMMLDRVCYRDDFVALPGDELLLPKRKSLKRLRKVIGGVSVSSGVGGGGGVGEVDNTDEHGNGDLNKGRQWSKRVWSALNLDEIKAQMLIDQPVLPKIDFGSKKKEENEKVKKTAGGKAGKPTAAAKDKKQPSSAKIDINATATATTTANVEGKNDIEAWVAKTQTSSIFESYVTTAHRCLIKTANEELEGYVAFYKRNVEGIRSKYESVYEKERDWERKWIGLVEDLARDAQGGGEEETEKGG